MNINGKWYTEPQLEAYVMELESRIANLEAKYHNESDELAEAKRLLQCAANDIQNLDKEGRCFVCKYDLRNVKKGLIGTVSYTHLTLPTN